MKVDILFLAKNRREYTEEALRQLERNTNWDLVSNLIIYNDGSEDSRPKEPKYTMAPIYQDTDLGSPVAVTNDYLTTSRLFPPVAPWFAKIDNDTVVPPGWLDACVAVAETDNVDLIGIEARYCENAPMQPVECSMCEGGRGNMLPHCPSCGLLYNPLRSTPAFGSNAYPIIKYRRTDHVGGIGLFRRSVFKTHPLPKPSGTYYGFTEWQWEHQDVRKCWIDPPLPVFLLDHLPVEPWRSLGKEYVNKGWQRESWGEYDEVKDRGLWEWWLNQPSSVKTG